LSALALRIGRRTFRSLRRHRNYRLFFAGQVVSLVGTWMQNIALAWYVVELTHSAVAVGFLAFCRFAPFTVFGLISGVGADRFDTDAARLTRARDGRLGRSRS
jgi:MFS family permease